MQHYLFPNEAEDTTLFDTDVFLSMDPMTGIKLNCKRLQRNDPAMTWMTTPRLSNPNIFYVLGQSLVNNTHCRELLLENVVLTRVAAKALAKGIAESNLMRLVIQNSIEERQRQRDVEQQQQQKQQEDYHDDGGGAVMEGQIRKILFQGIQASKTLVELTIQSVPIDQLTFLGHAITTESSGDEMMMMMMMSSIIAASSNVSPLSTPRPPGVRKLCLDRLILNNIQATEHLAEALRCATTLDCIHVRGQFQQVLQPPGRCLLQLLQDGIQSNSIIQELRIDGVPIEQLDGWRRVMTVMPAVHTVTLCDFHDPRGVDQYSQLLAQALFLQPVTEVEVVAGAPDDQQQQHQQRHIQTLQLFDGVLGRDALSHLAQNMRNHRTLTTLKLQSIHLDDNGFAMLVDNWGEHCRIQNLSLHYNDMGPGSVPRLLQCITTELQDLEWLDLSSNAFGYEGLMAIANELHHLPPRLTFLDIGDCANYREFDDSPAGRRAAQALVVAGRQTGLALLQGMQRNVYLEKLLLENNEFPPEILFEIQFYVSLNATGRRLLSMNHGLASTVWCPILARGATKFPEYEASILFYFLSEQPTLVPPGDEASRRQREERKVSRGHDRSSECCIL